MEEGKPYAFSYYLPMREAVVQYCANRGRDRDTILRLMVARAQATGGARGRKIAQDNAHAFNNFVDVFYPHITRFRRDLLRQQRTGCEFEGLELEGGPHIEVNDSNGKKRYVFLHAANWSKPDLLAYLELLSVIIEAVYATDRSSLWVLGLRDGREIKWRPSAQVKKRCRGAAKLYARFIRTMENPEAS
jgi:hypothetical protein